MTPTKLFVVLVFSLVVRGGVVATGSHLFAGFGSHLDIFGQLLFGALIFSLCIKEFKLSRPTLAKIFGGASAHDLLGAVLLGVVLLMLPFGESAIQAIVLSHFDPDLAYRWGNFHELVYPPQNFLSIHIGEFLIASIVIPAMVEEFFFRGLLLRALQVRRTFLQSAIISSALFTVLHPSGGVYLSCFAFAMGACLLYARTGSLYACMVMHATFNLLAFLSQHYFDFHRTRSVDQLRSVTDWIPQITLLAVALTLLTWWILRNKDPEVRSKAILGPLQQEL
jgi:membrane protease YdiL (CAAX protease family)